MSAHRVTLAAIALALATVTTAAAAQDTGFGGGPPETRYFRVESAVTAGRRGPQVEGYVYNLYDINAIRMRLRVESLDAAGRVLDTRFVFMPTDVPSRGRAFFSTPATPGAAAVRVSVLSFDWPCRGGM